MDRRDVDETERAESTVVAAARFWAVLPLGCVIFTLSTVLILGSDAAAPAGGWLWPMVTAVTVVCWVFRRSRPASRLLLLVLAVAFCWAVPFPPNPLETLESGEVSGLGAALLGVGAATVPRCVLAVVTLLGCVFSFGPTQRAADGSLRWKGFLSGLVVAALAIGVSVPAAFGLHAVSEARQVSRAEQIAIFDEPETSGVQSLPIGSQQGWSRGDVLAARPAGDVVIAVEAGPTVKDRRAARAILGLRTADGALLWRYRLKAPDQQNAVGSAIIDTTSRTVMIRYVTTLIGIDFDGHVIYRKPLAESVDPHDAPVLVGDALGEASGALQLGSVAVFGGNRAGTAAGFAAGYAVSTGERLWQNSSESDDCSLARVAGPGRRAYLMVGGDAPCHARLIAYEDGEQLFSKELKPPPGTGEWNAIADFGSFGSRSAPTIAAAGADRVTVAPLWLNEKLDGGTQQIVTQTFDSSGRLLGTLSADYARGAVMRFLPTAVGADARSNLGSVVLRPTGKPNDSDTRWVTLDPSLKPLSEAKIISGAGYQRAGPILVAWPWSGKGSDNVVNLYRIADRLRPPERLDPADLPRCTGQIGSISGDDTHLVIQCHQTVMVRTA